MNLNNVLHKIPNYYRLAAKKCLMKCILNTKPLLKRFDTCLNAFRH